MVSELSTPSTPSGGSSGVSGTGAFGTDWAGAGAGAGRGAAARGAGGGAGAGSLNTGGSSDSGAAIAKVEHSAIATPPSHRPRLIVRPRQARPAARSCAAARARRHTTRTAAPRPAAQAQSCQTCSGASPPIDRTSPTCASG
ncbi:MAG: hypothetical protein B7Z08_12245 [Sphingomonadales bacterium 32-68-7]|nr:MAG: hypothetical protein B7Z33_13300 [Sphingomonadales bacterium 12-68-11]OYX07507.1 MAG: hypothetical protein B7Z08_12245 [Sphingomonadales bacterium 32-68-7]